MSTCTDAVDLVGARSHVLASVAEPAWRAQDIVRLRSGFAPSDLIIALQAYNGIHAATTAAQVTASRRFAAPATQAFGASPGPSRLPPPRLAAAKRGIMRPGFRSSSRMKGHVTPCDELGKRGLV